METINFYQPPKGDGLGDITSGTKAKRPVYDTRWQAARAGIRRGSMPGMIVVTVVFGLILTGLLLSYYFGQLPRSTFPESWLFFCLQAVLIIFGGGFFYGAIPGGLMMMLIEVLRFLKPNRPPQDNTPLKESSRPVYNTRWQATLAGVRRGPVLGVVISTVFATIFAAGMLPITIFLLVMKTESILSSTEGFFRFVAIMPASIGVCLLAWAVGAIEYTILSGIIMGLIKMICFRKPK